MGAKTTKYGGTLQGFPCVTLTCGCGALQGIDMSTWRLPAIGISSATMTRVLAGLVVMRPARHYTIMPS
jgi:hypothetical protein